jgi:hypothetical protein
LRGATNIRLDYTNGKRRGVGSGFRRIFKTPDVEPKPRRFPFVWARKEVITREEVMALLQNSVNSLLILVLVFCPPVFGGNGGDGTN